MPEATDIPTPTASRLPHRRWRDGRLVLGVLLVLGSVVAGSRVVAAADTTVPVWAAGADLPAGAVLHAGDVTAVRVRLAGATGRYLGAVTAVDGRVLARPVGAGELLAAAALAAPAQERRAEVSVPVRAGHYPADLARNETVDVYVTPEAAPRAAAAAPRRVLALATVAQVRRGDGRLAVGSAGEVGVVLSVPRHESGDDPALGLVAAFQDGSVDLVRVSRP